MGVGDREIEIKYYVDQLVLVRDRLGVLGADLIQPRTHEYNLRFDTPAGELTRQSKVLRLRRDNACYLTYKEGSTVADGVSLRSEIEFEVNDFDGARALLESLGYQVSMVYEKYRAVYELERVLVTLDEMPFGDFVEIEGPDADCINGISSELGFLWDARIVDSYAALFQNVRSNLGLRTKDLTFDAFRDTAVLPDDLGVAPGGI